MDGDWWFYPVSAAWAAAVLVLWIGIIRLSYRIEERSPDLRNRTGLPRYAAIPFTLTNRRVARDAETQALRRRMLAMLALVAAAFVLFGAIVVSIGIA